MSQNIQDDKYKRAVNFDLNTAELKKIFSSQSPLAYLQGYRQIGRILKKNGFTHRQWSGYISKEPMTTMQILQATRKLDNALPRLQQCVEKIDTTLIDKTFDLTPIFTSTMLPLQSKETKFDEIESLIDESPLDELRKALNFDLDTNELKKIYKTDDPFVRLDAYRKIGKFLKSRGFTHRQYSGYITKDEMSTYNAIATVRALNQAFPWLQQCVRKFDVTSIGSTFDLIDIFKQPNMLEEMIESALLIEKISVPASVEQSEKENSPAFINPQLLHDNAPIAQEIYEKSMKQQTQQNKRNKKQEL